jgi:hypothetical protein
VPRTLQVRGISIESHDKPLRLGFDLSNEAAGACF